MNVVIAGLGLIGGSVALALRAARPDAEIVGVDRAAVLTTDAVKRLSSRLVDAADAASVDAAFERSDLVVLAAPVRVIVELVPRALAAAPLVTDCGSTKRSIAAAADACSRRGRFVPGHPMAGAREGGAELARADLFADRRWLICPEKSDPSGDRSRRSAREELRCRSGAPRNRRARSRRRPHEPRDSARHERACRRSVGRERRARGGSRIRGCNTRRGRLGNDLERHLRVERRRGCERTRRHHPRARRRSGGLNRNPPDVDAARALLRRAKQARSGH